MTYKGSLGARNIGRWLAGLGMSSWRTTSDEKGLNAMEHRTRRETEVEGNVDL